MPVAIGMIKEKLLVERALNNASAESMISKKAITNGGFNKNFNQSLSVTRLLPLNCHLINAAPETLKAAYNSMYKIAFAILFFLDKNFAFFS